MEPLEPKRIQDRELWSRLLRAEKANLAKLAKDAVLPWRACQRKDMHVAQNPDIERECAFAVAPRSIEPRKAADVSSR